MSAKLKRVYRIFTNDRGSRRGVRLYSALKQVTADSPEAAITAAKCPGFGPPDFGPVVAIEWPAVLRWSKEWLAKHV